MSAISCRCLDQAFAKTTSAPHTTRKRAAARGQSCFLLLFAVCLLLPAAWLTPASAHAQTPLVIFPPGTQSTLVTGFAEPEGVAVDSSGNFYVADTNAQGFYGGNSHLYKETKSGSTYSQSTIGGPFIGAWAVTVDGSGNVYVADYGNPYEGEPGAVYKETNSDGSYVQTKIGSGFVSPDGIAVDSNGNVYVADFGCNTGGCESTGNGGLYKLTYDSANQTYAQAQINSLEVVSGVSVDASNNLYVAVYTVVGTSGAVYKETLVSGNTYTQTTVSTDFITPGSAVSDPAGNVYVTDDNFEGGSGIVYKLTPSSGSYSRSTLITGLNSPEDAILDSNGNLYIANVTSWAGPDTGDVVEQNYANPPSLSFGGVNVGSTSSAQTVTVENIGAGTLDFDIPGSGTNPGISAGFTLATGSGDCPQVTSESSSPGTLASGASCTLPVTFAPQATGSYSGSSLVLTDNNPGSSTQTIPLSGTGTGTDKAAYLTVTGSSPVTAGVSDPVTVTAYDALGHVFTGYAGTVHFSSSDGQAVLPGNSPLSSGTGTFGVTLKTAGGQTVTATDTVTSSLTGQVPITVNPAGAAHLVLSGPSSTTSGSSFSLAVSAFDNFENLATGYTGTVHFTSTDPNATLPGNSTLSSGSGSFSATLRTAGSQTILGTDTVNGSITGTSNSITVDGPPTGAIGEAADATTMFTTIPQNDNLFVRGWAVDPQQGSPVSRVIVSIDGSPVGNAQLGFSRPDLAAEHGSSYLNSGWEFTTSVSGLSVGTHTVTAVASDALNLSAPLGSMTINVESPPVVAPPFGVLDEAIDATTQSTTVSQSDNLYVQGWAVDPQQGSPVSMVTISIDGTVVGNGTLGLLRPVLAAQHGSAYLHAGWELTMAASGLSLGKHTVIAVAHDSNHLGKQLGYATITVVGP